MSSLSNFMDDLVTLRTEAEAWIAEDPDPATKHELANVVEALPSSAADLADRFAGRLRFGTAGLRGPVRAGPNGMNRAVVRATTAGLIAYLQASGRTGPVVIGYDARRGSTAFAQDTAAVCAGGGWQPIMMPRPLPTPVLAYAMRRLDAAAGVMVTASHNPPADNGYKVYLDDGRQIVPPADSEIEQAIASITRVSDVPLAPFGDVVDDRLISSYVDDVVGLADASGPRSLVVAYTPLHGVGGELLPRVLTVAGFPAPYVVPEQADPNPLFPTVSFPNPEEPGAMDLVLRYATEVGAQLAIANDPDADRCAAAIPDPVSATGWRMLTGDEVGLLLADLMMRRGVRGTYATTMVSSSALGALCTARGQKYAETLTGFKWIMRAAPDLVYGYEEALGYSVAPDLVRDKDGISAALLLCELTTSLAVAGLTLADWLDELAREVGVHATRQLSMRFADLSEIEAAMVRLRADTPTMLLDQPVTEVVDALPLADVLTLRAPGLRVVVRPSGTEPKLKAYLEVVEPVGDEVTEARTVATKKLSALHSETLTNLGMSS